MRRILDGLLLCTRKARAGRSIHLHHSHYLLPAHVGHAQHGLPLPHIPSAISTHFCYRIASVSMSFLHPHLPVVPSAASSAIAGVSSSASECTRLSASECTRTSNVKHETKDLAHGTASASFSHPDSSPCASVPPSAFKPTKTSDLKLVSEELPDGTVVQCEQSTERVAAGSPQCEENTARGSSRGIVMRDLSAHETRRLLKLTEVEDFKKRMRSTGKHCMPLEEVMNLCKQTGTAVSDAEAEEIVKSLDEAGTILIFRRTVFLEPEKVAEALSRAMPLPLAQENDPRKQELSKMQKEKEEIDRIAHKQVRHMLWVALGALSAQSAIFFRLTFWELSWDVMEPIAFFVTSGSLLAGFFFFVITKRDPSYHDFMDTLFSSKQRKLMKKRNFDMERFKELQAMLCLPMTSSGASCMKLDVKHAY